MGASRAQRLCWVASHAAACAVNSTRIGGVLPALGVAGALGQAGGVLEQFQQLRAQQCAVLLGPRQLLGQVLLLDVAQDARPVRRGGRAGNLLHHLAVQARLGLRQGLQVEVVFDGPGDGDRRGLHGLVLGRAVDRHAGGQVCGLLRGHVHQVGDRDVLAPGLTRVGLLQEPDDGLGQGLHGVDQQALARRQVGLLLLARGALAPRQRLLGEVAGLTQRHALGLQLQLALRQVVDMFHSRFSSG